MQKFMIAAVCAGACAARAGEISSTFDSDAEGWVAFGDATGFTWVGDQGQPAGAVYARDQGAGDWWGFEAGPEFAGDLSAYAGGSLTWDVRTSDVGGSASEPTSWDVALTGAGLTIVADACVPTADAWSRRSVALVAERWRVSELAGAAVSEDDLRGVLAALETVRIRGEFSSARDSAHLDNVVLRTADLPYCRADCGADCKSDINDFICFQAKWRARDAFGDYNRDGRWNINDFIAFQADFRVGCR